MLKKVIIMLVSAMLICSALVTVPLAADNCKVTVSQKLDNKTFTVTVTYSDFGDKDGVVGVTGVLTYDSSVLEFVSVKDSKPSEWGTNAASWSKLAKKGTVEIYNLFDSGDSGHGTKSAITCTVTFKVLKEASTDIRVQESYVVEAGDCDLLAAPNVTVKVNTKVDAEVSKDESKENSSEPEESDVSEESSEEVSDTVSENESSDDVSNTSENSEEDNSEESSGDTSNEASESEASDDESTSDESKNDVNSVTDDSNDENKSNVPDSSNSDTSTDTSADGDGGDNGWIIWVIAGVVAAAAVGAGVVFALKKKK